MENPDWEPHISFGPRVAGVEEEGNVDVMSRRELFELVRGIKAVALDWDGCLTDNTFWQGFAAFAQDPDERTNLYPRRRSFYDGQGISFLRGIGIQVGFFTNEKGESARAVSEFVAKLNKLSQSEKTPGDGGWKHVHLVSGFDGKPKDAKVGEWLESIGVTWNLCAGMGDERVDVEFLRRVGLVIVPVTGEHSIKKMAHVISRRSAGHGALRDFVNFLLEVRGIDQNTLHPG